LRKVGFKPVEIKETFQYLGETSQVLEGFLQDGKGWVMFAALKIAERRAQRAERKEKRAR
jgi:hypothetical protein